MSEKKVILVLAVIFLLVSFLQSYLFLQLPSPPQITGKASASQSGTLSLCFNSPPQITTTAQTATVSSLFTYQVPVTDDNAGTTFAYYDNSSLFNIAQTGLISFTPQSADVGTHSIEITIDDNSNCSNSNASQTFLLTISAAPPAAEEAAAAAAEGGGGGAAGRAVPLTKLSFKPSQETLKVTLKQSQSLEKTITLTNDGVEDLVVEITNPFPNLVSFFPSAFDLPVGQTKELSLFFNPGQNAAPNVYFFLVKLKGTHETYTTKTLTIVLEIESEEVLFDASLDLLQKTLLPGQELKLTITLFKLRGASPAPVALTYLISHPDQSILYQENETIIVEEQVSFSKIIPLPKGIAPGQYLLSLNIRHADSFATASELFTLEAPPSALAKLTSPFIEKPGFLLSLPFILLAILLVLIALFVALHFLSKKIKRSKTLDSSEITRLKRKLVLLQESYRKGYLRKETYQKTRSQLQNLISQKTLKK